MPNERACQLLHLWTYFDEIFRWFLLSPGWYICDYDNDIGNHYLVTGPPKLKAPKIENFERKNSSYFYK